MYLAKKYFSQLVQVMITSAKRETDSSNKLGVYFRKNKILFSLGHPGMKILTNYDISCMMLFEGRDRYIKKIFS